MTEDKLNQLFDAARNAEIKTSREEVMGWLSKAVVAGAAAGTVAAGFKVFFTKNVFFMIAGTIGVTGAVVISATMLSSSPNPNETSTEFIATSNKQNSEVKTDDSLKIDNLITQNELPVSNTGHDTFQFVPTENVPDEVRVYTLTGPTDAPRIYAMSVQGDSTDRQNRSVARGLRPLTNLTAPGIIAPITIEDDTTSGTHKREIDVSPFTKLWLDGVFNVVINQGADEKIIVESSTGNESVSIDLSDGSLIVYSGMYTGGCEDRKPRRQKVDEDITLYITVKKLDELYIQSIGNVTISGLTQNELMIEFSGVGNLDLNLSCGSVDFYSSGVGEVRMSGTAKSMMVEYTGVGDLKAADFKVDDLVAYISGIGDVTINAIATLSLEGSGVGDIRYKGDPEISSLSFSGIGTLSRIKD